MTWTTTLYPVSNEPNPLPDFFYHLGNAQEAVDIYEGADLYRGDIYREKLRCSLMLIEYCVQHADSLRKAFTKISEG